MILVQLLHRILQQVITAADKKEIQAYDNFEGLGFNNFQVSGAVFSESLHPKLCGKKIYNDQLLQFNSLEKLPYSRVSESFLLELASGLQTCSKKWKRGHASCVHYMFFQKK